MRVVTVERAISDEAETPPGSRPLFPDISRTRPIGRRLERRAASVDDGVNPASSAAVRPRLPDINRARPIGRRLERGVVAVLEEAEHARPHQEALLVEAVL